MNKAMGMLVGATLLAILPIPAHANLVAFGIDYSVTGSGADTNTANFILHISGINGAADTEGGRVGVNAFAFSNVGLPGLTGSSTFGTFANDSGLNSNGCNGSGAFFCFSAVPQLGNTPALAADSVIDIPFSLTITAGNDFLAYIAGSPSFKIDWAGCKNPPNCTANYDNVSLGGALTPTTFDEENPPGGTPIPGAVWLFGTVLAGGAGFGRWRKKRKAQLAA